MLFKTHIAIGVLVLLIALRIISPENVFLFSFLIMLGSAFPDMDHPKSKLGNAVWPISLLFEHRGFFHSLVGAFVFSGFLYLVLSDVMYVFGFFLGYLSHIISDAFSKQGIMPFHPISRLGVRGGFKTGAYYEYALLFVIVAVDLFLLIYVL